MSAGRPLSHLSLRSILYHMEPNIRFNIARCCPSIEKLEKEVSLKINHLIFSAELLTINRSHYKLSLVRETFGEGVNSKYEFESDEDNKLVNHRYSYLNSQKPGTSNTSWSDYVDPEEDLAENAEWEALRKVMDHGPRVNVCHHIYVQCWYGSQENLKPRERIERLAYNKTLTEAREYLANKFLSGRVVYVDSLFIMDDKECMPPIPSKAKLTVAHLKEIKNEESYSAVRSILDGTPLESVWLKSPERFDDPLISTAKKVIVNGYASVLLKIDWKLPRVHVVGIENTLKDLGDLLSNFTTQGRPAGTFYSLEIWGPWSFESLFEEIKNTSGANIMEIQKAGKYSGYAILRIIDGCELHVRCVPFEGFRWGGVGTLNFQFYPKGYSGLTFSS